MPKLVIFDTNFLLVPGQFGVDVIGELHRILDVKFEIGIPDVVRQELEVIERKSRGKDLLAIKMAKSLIERFNVVKLGRYGEKPTDELILEFALKMPDVIVCTNDKGLRKKLREKGIPVIYLRQRKILVLEGMID
ncbi:PIN domain-containing protein [Palaeococcus sp. (in: euryarchaeotes)]|uniref:PIN domain-containing protein n=1 Tax=Palaeococcus sp. (in: euryarchaeotes) TaxID=2820298 RepID=UPI000F2DA5EB|nr:PIN domain-containing protein [Palaeococcus sp. (in: euryarchaeotes)]MCD6558854.1 nucleotide-binding protein [Palaeococcus sp. (in: euryarchaeotes)]RLF78479.1 MAG: nucleotide-binding protein [Thermococci archaeon]